MHILSTNDPSDTNLVISTTSRSACLSSDEKHLLFQQLLRSVLPMVGSQSHQVILAEVLLTLRIEGLIGKTLSAQDIALIQVIHDSIMASSEKTDEAMVIAAQFLN